MQFEVLVETRPRAGVADPEGATIERSLPALGFDGVTGVRVGKVFRFTIEASDAAAAQAEGQLGGDARPLWHGDDSVGDLDAVVLPGGFAHGDYLRPGAIARFSPVMDAVVEFARGGGPVIGICNGFQVLTEAGLLPGALQRNAGLKFLCEPA